MAEQVRLSYEWHVPRSAFLLNLPDELMVDGILNFLDRLSVCRLVSVCKQLRQSPAIDLSFSGPGRILKFQDYFCVDDGNPIGFFAAGIPRGIPRFGVQECKECAVRLCQTGYPAHFCPDCDSFFCKDHLSSATHSKECASFTCQRCESRDNVFLCQDCGTAECVLCRENGERYIVTCDGCGTLACCKTCGMSHCYDCESWYCQDCDPHDFEAPCPFLPQLNHCDDCEGCCGNAGASAI